MQYAGMYTHAVSDVKIYDIELQQNLRLKTIIMFISEAIYIYRPCSNKVIVQIKGYCSITYELIKTKTVLIAT